MINAPKDWPGLFCISALLITASVLTAGCQRDHGYAVLASMFKVEGRGFVHHSDARSPAKEVLSSRSQLAAGDTIEIGDESTAALSLIPGIFVELQPHTIFKIEELRVAKDGNETADGMKSRSAIIQLQRGAIRARLPNRGTGRCLLSIKIDEATVAAGRKSLFSLRVVNDFAWIVCVRGTVIWQAKPSVPPVRIVTGEFVETKLDGTAAQAKPISKNVEAETEADAIIGTSGFLDDLTANERDRPFPWRRR